MKSLRNIIFVVICFFTIDSSFGQKNEQIPTVPIGIRTVIKGNPFTMIAGVIPLSSEYRLITEYAVSKNQTTQIGISYLGKSPIFSLIEQSTPNPGINLKWKMYGFRAQVWHKFYLTQLGEGFSKNQYSAPKGFYIAPQVSYATVQMSNNYFQFYDIYIRATHFNANLMFGAQVFLGNISIDFFTGLGYKKNEWIQRNSPTQIIVIDPNDLGLPSSYSNSVKFSLGFNIGYGF